MKTIASLVLIFLPVQIACAGIEFTAILADASGVRVRLIDSTTHENRWLQLGESFREHKLTGYDNTTESITLEKDGRTLRVNLRAAKVQPEPTNAEPKFYIVQRGDSASKVARNHAIPISDLVAVNPGIDWATLRVGQKINLP